MVGAVKEAVGTDVQGSIFGSGREDDRSGGYPRNPRFYGKNARGIRGTMHGCVVGWTKRRRRTRSGKIKDVERLKVNDIPHKISGQTVDEAVAQNAFIALGDLKGIRRRDRESRRLNRIVANMPYFKLSSFISYKAAWEGIPVYQVKEAWTSKDLP